MDISLTKLIFILASLFLHGSPSKISHDAFVGAKVSFGPGLTTEVSFDFSYDPILIYLDKRLPNNYCGMAMVSSIYLAPDQDRERFGCKYTYEHEMAHIWQYRQHGLLGFVWYLVFNESFEPRPGSESVPWHKKVMNFPLMRISISLPLER